MRLINSIEDEKREKHRQSHYHHDYTTANSLRGLSIPCLSRRIVLNRCKKAAIDVVFEVAPVQKRQRLIPHVACCPAPTITCVWSLHLHAVAVFQKPHPRVDNNEVCAIDWSYMLYRNNANWSSSSTYTCYTILLSRRRM